MAFKVNKEICIGCGACQGVCPFNAISMDENHKSQIDPQICQSCGACASVCPVGAIAKDENPAA